MSKQTHLHDFLHNRKEFQLDRLILFSDAVFAIAITLLVIEIKVPLIEHANSHQIMDALKEKFSEFFGFFLSFAVIGQFWITHHRMFGYVTGYTNGLLWLNLLVLFWIVLIPFTSGLNSHYGNLDIVWVIYSLNMFMISFSLNLLYRYIGNEKRNISILSQHPELKKFSFERNISIAIVFLLGAVLCIPGWLWSSIAARFVFFLIPVAIAIINKRAAKARQPAEKESGIEESADN